MISLACDSVTCEVKFHNRDNVQNRGILDIGSSGSGKSTFLRSINLLESPSGGEILYHGDNVLEKGYDLTTYRERLGMVFQSFNLFENLNVLENAIVAQTTVLKRDRKEAESIAKANLEKVGMGEQYWKAKPKQLSGGQKQRVAFSKTLRFSKRLKDWKTIPSLSR